MKISAIQRLTLLDFPDHTACTIFTLGCNFRCHYCHNSEFVLPEKIKKIVSHCIPEDKISQFLEKRKKLLQGVCITGGEPTIHNDLPEFIQKIKAQGFLVKLDTNGSNPQMLELLLKKNLLDYVAMDIKTHPGEYEKIIAVKGFSEKIKESKKILEVYKKNNSNFNFEFRTVIIPKFHTLERKEKLFEFVGNKNTHRLSEFVSTNGCLNPEWE